VQRLQGWLTNQSYQDIILVSHSMVIKMFISLIKFGIKLQTQQLLDFYETTSIANGGITLCSYDTSWKVEYVNKKI